MCGLQAGISEMNKPTLRGDKPGVYGRLSLLRDSQRRGNSLAGHLCLLQGSEDVLLGVEAQAPLNHQRWCA
jgi:hypothetical protein